MSISDYERGLLSELSRADSLIAACVRGQISGSAFLEQHDSSFQRWAMDGHEASVDEQRILSKYKARIDVLARVWSEVECRVTDIQPTPASWLGPDDVPGALMRLLRHATR